MSHLISNALVPGDIYFDIGANIGDEADFFVQRGMAVVCVEPQPDLANRLVQRFSGISRVNVVPMALGQRAGVALMSISSATPTLSTFASHWKQGRFAGYVWDKTAEVKMITLDDLVRDFGVPRYCKIDVEGFEREVLAELSRRIGIISYEYTSEFMGHALEVLLHLLNLGYRSFNLSIGEGASFQFDRWVEYYELASILHHSREQKDLWGDIYAN